MGEKVSVGQQPDKAIIVFNNGYMANVFEFHQEASQGQGLGGVQRKHLRRHDVLNPIHDMSLYDVPAKRK